MAGGIFIDQPFSPNWKCIIFGIALMIAYWWLPKNNPFLLPVIFIIGYIAMAWYDYMYDCDMMMYSGSSLLGNATLDAWAKPQRRDEVPKYNSKNTPAGTISADQEAVYKTKVYSLHIFVIAPILAYVGWFGKKANPHIFAVIGSLAFLVLLYHGGRLWFPRQTTECPEEKKEERSVLLTVYLLHVIIIFPLLAYVAIKGRRSDPRAFSSLLFISISTFIYHGFRFFYPRTVKQCQKKID